MDDTQSDLESLKGQVTQLQSQVDMLSRDLDRAVQLIDRYGETLGRHLKGVVVDQGALSRRLGILEHSLLRSA